MKAAALGFAAGLVIGLANASFADELVAAEQISGTNVGFVLTGSHRNATLTIAGPGDFSARAASPGGAVAIDLSRFAPLPDGTYNYHLTAASSEMVRAGAGLDDGREGDSRRVAHRPAAKSGTFNVRGGRIVDHGTERRAGRRDTR